MHLSPPPPSPPFSTFCQLPPGSRGAECGAILSVSPEKVGKRNYKSTFQECQLENPTAYNTTHTHSSIYMLLLLLLLYSSAYIWWMGGFFFPSSFSCVVVYTARKAFYSPLLVLYML
jgi:hypothetical protein